MGESRVDKLCAAEEELSLRERQLRELTDPAHMLTSVDATRIAESLVQAKISEGQEATMDDIVAHTMQNMGLDPSLAIGANAAKQEALFDAIEGKTVDEVVADLPGILERMVHAKLQPFKRTEKAVGRNDPCTCGSGRKYKKCKMLGKCQPQK